MQQFRNAEGTYLLRRAEGNAVARRQQRRAPRRPASIVQVRCAMGITTLCNYKQRYRSKGMNELIDYVT